MQPVEKRIEIGRLVAESFKELRASGGTTKRFVKVKVEEDGIKYTVNFYPPNFSPTIDVIISLFYKYNPVLPPAPPKERKRFSVKRPVASSKPSNR